ncbi:MAG: hypothetical protein ACRD11_07460 [Terriglobia bacterium]
MYLTVRAFQCPDCSEWLSVPWYEDVLGGLVPAVGAGLAAYGLAFRGFDFLIATLVGFWILLVPASLLLDRLLPVHPRKTVPSYAAVGLFGTVHRQPNRDKQEGKQDQRQGEDRRGS